MASLNQCNFIGNLGADPAVNYSASGAAITNISIACTETWKDKQTGEKQERTEWVRITFFGRLAEIASEYLKKGSQVYVSGKMQTDKYTDSNGVEKYSTKIVGREMKMLGSKSSGGGQDQGQSQSNQQNQSQQQNESSFADDDIPF